MTIICNDRRRFLALSARGMVLLSTAALGACGGGGGDAGSTPGGGAGGGAGGGGATPADFGGDGAPAGGSAGAAVSLDSRVATLSAVRDMVAGLAAGSASWDSAALARSMQALPGLERVGISSRLGNVWARFTDGRLLVVPNNLEPGGATGALASPTSAASDRPRASAARKRIGAAGDGDFELPSLLVAQQYRQLDMFGQVPVGSAPDAAHLCQDFVGSQTLPDLRAMAVGRGFALPAIQTAEPPDAGTDNGVVGLSSVSGDGVFFITACAAQAGNDSSPRTVICTATRATAQNLARHEAELNAGLLVHAVAMRGVAGAWQPVECIAITAEFVTASGWQFPVESLGIFNLTGGASLSDWIAPLNRAGLRHILGWEQPVSWQRMLAFADDLIQLNLATNNFAGTRVRQTDEPRLRAYGMGESLGYLIQRGLIAGPAAFYLQERTPALYVNVLVPTITYALIREGQLEFELNGQFGHRADTADGVSGNTVTARIIHAQSEGGPFAERLLGRAADPLLPGGQTLADPPWRAELLQTVLDQQQLARGGYVQVVNGGRCSNVVPITHWEIPFQAVTTIDELTLTVTVTIRLRADVHGWRLDPLALPRNGNPQSGLQSSVHSRADFSASGSISRNDAPTRTTTTISWSGAGSITNAIGAFFVSLGGFLSWDTRQLSFVSLSVQGGGVHQQRKLVEQFDVNGQVIRRTDETVDVPVALTVFGPGEQGLFELGFDDQWNLRPGQFDMLPVDDGILPAPPQRVRRTRVSWPSVRPDFPPRADYGGT
jgi:hypothetical protein